MNVTHLQAALTRTITTMDNSRSVLVHRSSLNDTLFAVREALWGAAKDMPTTSVRRFEASAAADDVGRAYKNLWRHGDNGVDLSALMAWDVRQAIGHLKILADLT